MRRLALLLCLLALAGCATSEFYAKRLSAFVGASEADLVRQFGVPVRTYAAGGSRFLEYNAVHVSHDPGTPGYWRTWRRRGRVYREWVPGIPPSTTVWQCRTTWEIVQARVRNFSFAGNGCIATDPDGRWG